MPFHQSHHLAMFTEVFGVIDMDSGVVESDVTILIYNGFHGSLLSMAGPWPWC